MTDRLRRAPESFTSTCSYCGVGCGLKVHRDNRDRIRVEGDPDHPVNRGMLCAKGLNLRYAMEDRGDRLRHPQMRSSRAHPLRRVSWETAMERAAAVFKAIIRQHGPDSVGFYVSGQCLTEEYYLANKLVKGFLGTNNLDTNSRLCMSSAVAAHAMMLGEDSVPICYDDIELADCFLIAGANPAWCHPILFRRLERHKAQNPDVRVIVVDPRRTESSVLADLHLPVKPGTDVQLFNAIARSLIEADRVDHTFIDEHVDGYAAYRDAALALTVTEAADLCGVAPDLIHEAATYIGDANGFLTMWAMGMNQSAHGVEKNLALMSLNLITGKIGKPGSGPFSLTGQPNAMGGREVGGMASLLAAHRNLANPVHRNEVADFWGVESINETPGYTATEMFDALGNGKLKAVWIIGTNPMVSLPDLNRAEQSLNQAKFVVVQDISNRSDTLRFADLVLPAAGHFEKDGTMTNSERRISHLQKVVDPPGEALPDTQILMRFAQTMGFPGFDFENTAEIFEEYTRLTTGTEIDISGLTHDRLLADGALQWPVPTADGGDTKRLFTNHRFYTDTQKAKLIPIGIAPSRSERTSPEFPLVLTTGRIRDQWHTMTKTGKVNRLREHIRDPFLAIHPTDALSRGISDGDTVRISNSRGEVRVRTTVTTDIRPGVVFLPMHWGRVEGSTFARANNLTHDRVDPISKEPDFKLSAVQVTRLEKRREKIAVIGAGASAFQFVNAYRALNQDDEIHVFSGEPHPFYDRVLLPGYVSERLSWSELLKFQQAEIDKLDIRIHASTEIAAIDKKNRTLTDRAGEVHSYDKLVVGTGSAPFVPPGAPMGEPGIFTMRTRQDADALKAHLGADGHVLVVGGGLLGLELAGALDEMGIDITIVELGARLMERQLDPLSAELLMDYVEERGIVVHVNDQVRKIEPARYTSSRRVEATLRSGKTLRLDAVIYAIGTRPRVGLLADAGLDCGRGVLVSDCMQTSDPDIYAMGEVAEHRGTLHGITAAAERQAEVVARHIAGDELAAYEGSASINVLKLTNLDLCSIGLPVVPAGEKGYEEILFIDRAERHYKKCIIKDDRLVGAILIGDKVELGEFRNLIESEIELSDRRKQLLRSSLNRAPVVGKVVCSCNQVGEGNLVGLVEDGCTDFDRLCATSGAGIGCGSCKPEIRRLLGDQLIEVPA